ncbi:hypothetical protein MSAN_00212600 [Mycena sanguinolenta]|uniref:Uncharacterized protein n=1 Tax=Mycena sanguinolenta TaxID=230812 RepID=A0A8H7DJP2_9AGAR|nr:hypothetical protein MSAN_00212600 [Mycena sanguinolenta]
MPDSLHTSANPGWTGDKRYSPTNDDGDSVSLLILDDTSHETKTSPALEEKSFLRKHLLSVLCFALHLALMLLHVAVLISAMRHWEHRFTFAVDQQATVSFWMTVAIQIFGTGYAAILLFLTQTLAMRRNFGPNRTLTAIHDTISAWAGLGSALVSLWNQVSVPASGFATFIIVGYLCCISLLHISIPAMISVEVFNATVAAPATTLGIPEYANVSVINSTRDYMTTFATNILPFRGLFENSMLGLLNGTIYEVLTNTTTEKGTAQVSALGLNISCGYVPAQIRNVERDTWEPGNTAYVNVVVDGSHGALGIHYDNTALLPNSLSIYAGAGHNNSIYLSTTTVVVDSQGNLGAPIIFAQQPTAIFKNLTESNLNSSQIQFLKCSKLIVPQSATVDATSNNILDGSLCPNIYKNHSTWVPAAELNFASESSTLVGSGLWSEILGNADDPINAYIVDNWDVNEYLMSYLGLDPFANATSMTLNLHDIENAIASALAMVFWGAGHVKVNPWYIKYSTSVEDVDTLVAGTFPELVAGTATVMQQDTSRVRLNFNIAMVALGLATGIVQLLFCLTLLCAPAEHESSTEGRGLIHNIWVWRKYKRSITNYVKSTKDVDHQHPFDQHLEDITLVDQPRLTGPRPASPSGKNYTKIGIALHVLLVAIFVTIFGVAAAKMEHHVIFPIADQQSASFLCKVVAMVFGTIYYSVLVYLTQKLAIAQAAQEYSVLTATHDKTLAWTGIGSAISTLWAQAKVPGSPLQILYIFGYLATISVLHIATPALVSVESFDLSLKTEFYTRGIPKWSNVTDKEDTLLLFGKSGAFLPWITNLDPTLTLGLSDGSLYDIPESASSSGGSAGISAVGFNITCGYIPGLAAKAIGGDVAEGYLYNISSSKADFEWVMIDYLPGKQCPNTILISNGGLTNIISEDGNRNDSIILYTKSPVYDTDGNLGSPVTLPHSNNTLQLLRVLVPNSLSPTIQKRSSKWRAYKNIESTATQDESSLLEGNYWVQILTGLDETGILYVSGIGVDWGSFNLMQQLGLNPARIVNGEAVAPNFTQSLYLHDIENALAALVSSVFWIGNSSKLTR